VIGPFRQKKPENKRVGGKDRRENRTLKIGAENYRVLQCVVVCCGVLRCVAVCCSMSHCVALCCIVLQFVRERKTGERTAQRNFVSNTHIFKYRAVASNF